jgi:hypothetical protein
MENPRPRSLLLSILIFVAVAGVGLWFGIRSRQGWGSSGSGGNSRNEGQEAAQAIPDPAPNDQSPQAVIFRMFKRLRGGPLNPGELDAFREMMLSADPAAAMAAIQGFLATGQDARTGEKFEIGKNGELAGAPTFRVLLIDLHGRIAREHGSNDAGLAARALMQSKTSADEWALALRNAAWATPSDKDYLSAKTRELLAHEPWRQQPSAGYYEAFDVIVYTRNTGFITTLSEMVRGEDLPLKNTAATTLDRLATMAPLDVMNFLNANPAELSDKQFLRADYYAKADFTQSAQRAAVEAYLDRQDVDPGAKAKLITALGQPGVFVSDNLLTDSPAPPEEDIAPQQKAALQRAVDDWLNSNRYPSFKNQLLGKQEALQ